MNLKAPCGLKFSMLYSKDLALYEFHLKVCDKCKDKAIR